MIPLAAPPPLPSDVFGCRIETLWRCYHRFPELFTLYQTQGGGLLARLDDRLWQLGPADADELAAFAGWCGAGLIAGREADLPRLPGWHGAVHAVLRCPSCDVAPLPPDDHADLRIVYEILSCDDDFAAQSSFLPWLSDLRRRMATGCAHVYLLDDAATALVTAVGCHHALITSVATLPCHRRRGLATRLVGGACAHLLARGLTPVVVAQNAQSIPFYQRLGFLPAGRQVMLFPSHRKESPHR